MPLCVQIISAEMVNADDVIESITVPTRHLRSGRQIQVFLLDSECCR
jgi:hypothetical protein